MDQTTVASHAQIDWSQHQIKEDVFLQIAQVKILITKVTACHAVTSGDLTNRKINAKIHYADHQTTLLEKVHAYHVLHIREYHWMDKIALNVIVMTQVSFTKSLLLSMEVEDQSAWGMVNAKIAHNIQDWLSLEQMPEESARNQHVETIKLWQFTVLANHAHNVKDLTLKELSA